MLESLDLELIRLQLNCKNKVDHLLSGMYRSVFKGRGLEFDEVRPYQSGDDVRSIDWNVTARSGQPYIKRYHEERECSIMFLVDVSASCDYASGEKSKRDLMTIFCAHMAFAALRNNDRTGLLLFSDTVESYTPPLKGKSGVMRILQDIMTFDSQSEKTHLAQALDFFAKLQHKRSIVFVLSDFQDEDYWEELSILAVHHELVVVCINDLREKELPASGLVKFKDMETGEEHLADLSEKRARNLFKEKQSEWFDSLQQKFTDNGLDHLMISSDDDILEKILAFFHERERRVADESGG
ncbi:MAG: DUF58 domain-containing protein [Planctomycetes bacterium]|nr:DUF58 domain-containing protein [Planctomycetota bacterium]